MFRVVFWVLESERERTRACKPNAAEREALLSTEVRHDSLLSVIASVCFCVPQPLIKAVGSEDESLQEAAAGCIRNIRLTAKAYAETK